MIPRASTHGPGPGSSRVSPASIPRTRCRPNAELVLRPSTVDEEVARVIAMIDGVSY